VRIFGIDPGLTGAIAVLEKDGTLVALSDLPILTLDKTSWVDGSQLLSFLLDHRGTNGYQAVVEHVSSMPKQGVASSFKFGVGFGSLLGCLQAAAMPIALIRPAKWKRDLGLSGGDKHKSLALARLNWPTAELHLQKHDGRAEALLLAGWWRNRYLNQGA
jgi:crossover junction endodeoxyribonuclease RuvC